MIILKCVLIQLVHATTDFGTLDTFLSVTVFYGKDVRIVLEKHSYQHPAFMCSKSTLETPVQYLKSVKSQQ